MAVSALSFTKGRDPIIVLQKHMDYSSVLRAHVWQVFAISSFHHFISSVTSAQNAISTATYWNGPRLVNSSAHLLSGTSVSAA